MSLPLSRGLIQNQTRLDPNSRVERSKFLKTSTHQTAFDADYLVPIHTMMMLPGDYVQMSVGGLITMPSPMVGQLMDDIQVELYAFLCPFRRLWLHWANMMGEREDPSDNPDDYDIPQYVAPAGGFTIGNFWDYCGVATGVEGVRVNALIKRGYNWIHDYWFRDQDLEDSSFPYAQFAADADATSDPPLLTVNARGDYFVNARPWLQKGEAVGLSIAGSAPVRGTGKALGLTDGTNTAGAEIPAGDYRLSARADSYGGTVGAAAGTGAYLTPEKILGITTDGDESGMEAILASAYAGTINDLRMSIMWQTFYEMDAESGTRTHEYNHRHFGVITSDGRLSIPEYLGQGMIKLGVNTVVQSSESNVTNQGHRTSFAEGLGGMNFSASAEETSLLMVVAVARANRKYHQGVPRWMSYKTRLEFPDPVFAHAGWQTVYVRELYLDDTTISSGVDGDAFGYCPRYDDMRQDQNVVSSVMRPSAALPLDYYNLADQLEPDLGTHKIVASADFSESKLGEVIEGVRRSAVVAVTTQPHFMANFYFRKEHTTCIPVKGMPFNFSNVR